MECINLRQLFEAARRKALSRIWTGQIQPARSRRESRKRERRPNEGRIKCLPPGSAAGRPVQTGSQTGLAANPFRVLSNAAGFSLVGVLTAASVGVVVALGLSQLQVNTMKTVKVLESKFNQIELAEEIKNLLQNRAACRETLKTISNAPKTGGRQIWSIKDSSGVTKYTVGDVVKSGTVRIQAMRLIPSGISGVSSVSIEIFFFNSDEDSKTRVNLPKSITVNRVQADSSSLKTITNCV